MNKREKASYRINILYSYIFLIFLLSSLPPGVVSSSQFHGLDKIIHLLEYFILGIIFKYSI